MSKKSIPQKERWIYWRWKKDGSKTFSKSYIQDVIQTTGGALLELSDYTFYTQYPTRVLLKEIEIF